MSAVERGGLGVALASGLVFWSGDVGAAPEVQRPTIQRPQAQPGASASPGEAAPTGKPTPPSLPPARGGGGVPAPESPAPESPVEAPPESPGAAPTGEAPPVEAPPAESPGEAPPVGEGAAPAPAPEGPPEPEPIAPAPVRPAAAKPSGASPGPTPTTTSTKVAPSSPAPSPEEPTAKPKDDRAAKRAAREAEEDADEKAKDPKKKGGWKHRGTIFEAKIGALGCMRKICNDSTRHDASAGLALGGFFGRNILGLLDVGLEAGWGKVRPDSYSGRNALALYGLDPNALVQAIAEDMGVPSLNVDFSTLTVAAAKSQALHVGPTLRLHVIPRGRLSAYVGAGIHYQQWRNDYTTAGGALRLNFHGLSLPLTAGLGFYVLRRLAIGGEFTYVHPFFLGAAVRHPELDTVVPLLLVRDVAQQAGVDLDKELPTFWTAVLSVRVRL